MTATWTFAIQEEGYGFTDNACGVLTETKGGPSRSRNDLDDVNLTVQFTAKLNSDAEFASYQTFYAANNALPFNIALPIDSGTYQTQTATIVSAKLAQIVAHTYFVDVVLEVVPQPVSDAADLAIVNAYP